LTSSTRIRAVFFDLDGTLRHSIPASTDTFFTFAAQLGAEDSPERRWRAARWTHYYWAQSPELLADIEHFKTLSSEFWVSYAQRSLVEFGCSLEQAQRLAPEVHRLMTEEYAPVDYVAEDVQPTLRRLKKGGFKLGVISHFKINWIYWGSANTSI
jgi:phosphoglycolate phosphatase-like HAD superfamily hydrolase